METTGTGKRMGRQRFEDPTRRKQQRSFSMDQAQLAWIDAEATRREVAASQIVREAVQLLQAAAGQPS